jgi:hypothetical protein
MTANLALSGVMATPLADREMVVLGYNGVTDSNTNSIAPQPPFP